MPLDPAAGTTRCAVAASRMAAVLRIRLVPATSRFISTIAHAARYEESIKKSRFIGVAGPVKSSCGAAAFLNEQSDPKATHK